MTVRVTAVRVIVCVGLTVGGIKATGAETGCDALRDTYNLDLGDARHCFEARAARDPTAPAPYRGMAETYLLEVALTRGAVNSDDMLGDGPAADLRVRPVSLELREDLRATVQHALAAAEARLREFPDDADAHYEVGSSVALLAAYSATIDGRVMGALRLARRAYKENNTALTLDPRRADAGLVVGTYQYLLSVRGFAVRWFAHIAGLASDKADGIRLVEAAARYPGDNQTEAQLVLEVIYNREQRYTDALRILADLRARFPRNRLLWLEAGGTALRAGQLEEAERLLNEGMQKVAADRRALAFGEEALWSYKRGAVRVLRHHSAEASADLHRSLALEARDRIRGRAHTELGKLNDMAGHRATAIQEYQLAAALAKKDGDWMGLADARSLVETPYHP